MKALISALVFFLSTSLVLAGDAKPKAILKLERTVGYRNGDVVIARVVVSDVPEGFVLDGKSFPGTGSRLNNYAEFAGWKVDGQEIILRAQIFRLVDGVWSMQVPFPKLVFKNKEEILSISLRPATILFGPLSSNKLIQFLPSLLPPAIDTAREHGPFSLMALGIIAAIFAVLIFICDLVEKRRSPALHPYIAALRKLKKLKQKPKEIWTDECFKIFHQALDARFGKTMFSHDPDVKYLTERGRGLMTLSDRRLYFGQKIDFSEETIMEATTEFFTKMLWEES